MGSNPRAEVWANLAGVRGDYTNGTVSGCGYDKESAAVDLALKDNPLMQTLMMWPKLNVNTGYSGQVTRVVNKLDYGYELCFGGMGMSELWTSCAAMGSPLRRCTAICSTGTRSGVTCPNLSLRQFDCDSAAH